MISMTLQSPVKDKLTITTVNLNGRCFQAASQIVPRFWEQGRRIKSWVG